GPGSAIAAGRAASASGPTPQDRADRHRAVALAPAQRPNLGIDHGHAARPAARAETGRAANPGRSLGRSPREQCSRDGQRGQNAYHIFSLRLDTTAPLTAPPQSTCHALVDLL